MDSQQNTSPTTSFSATMLYALCMIVGLLIGYLVRGNTGQIAKTVAPASVADGEAHQAAGGMRRSMPTLDRMRGMADKKAEPLLQQLKTDPKNAELLFQIGKVYESAHQFKEAVSYFDQSLQVDPKNLNVISEKAACLFYAGDADNAITTLNTALEYSPTDPRVLFNLGMMRWQGKGDAQGAIEVWQKLLKSNPKLPAQNKTQVEALIKKASSPVHQQAQIAQ